MVAFSAVIIIANLIGYRLATLFTALAVISPVGVALSQQLTGAADGFGGDELPELFVLIVVLALIAVSTRMLTKRPPLSGLQLVCPCMLLLFSPVSGGSTRAGRQGWPRAD